MWILTLLWLSLSLKYVKLTSWRVVKNKKKSMKNARVHCLQKSHKSALTVAFASLLSFTKPSLVKGKWLNWAY